MIAECIRPTNPNLVNTFAWYSQWMLSKAFSASKARRREGVLVLLAKCITLISRLVASAVWRPFGNPDWFSFKLLDVSEVLRYIGVLPRLW